MHVFITANDAVLVELELPETANVTDLKNEISAKMSDIKVSEQILKYKSKVLFGPSTMKESGITENSIIELLVLRKNSIFIKMANGKLHEFEVDFNKTIDVVKKQITQSLNISSECQRLFSELKNKDVLSTKMIGPGATIDLCVTELNLELNLVRTDYKPELIKVQRNQNISQLKDIIEAKWKIPSIHQMLSVNDQILDDRKLTLGDYNMLNMSTILVKPINVEIFIDFEVLFPNRKISIVQVFLQDNVEVLKKQIKNTLKIDVDSQNLIWNDSITGDRDILADIGIVSGSTLIFIPVIKPFPVNILSGRFLNQNISVTTNKFETVAELTEKYKALNSVKLDSQTLRLGFTQLLSDKYLFEYGIRPYSSLLWTS